MQDFDASQLNIENDLGNTDFLCRTKASDERVDGMENHMDTLASKTDINTVYNRMEAYTTLEKYNKSQIKQAEQNEKHVA